MIKHIYKIIIRKRNCSCNGHSYKTFLLIPEEKQVFMSTHPHHFYLTYYWAIKSQDILEKGEVEQRRKWKTYPIRFQDYIAIVIKTLYY